MASTVPFTPASPSAPADEAAAGAGGGDEVTLPLTGARVWLIAGAGVVLLTAGIVALAATRHRRVRTVA
ncbi:hypothetical protein [Actinoplanes sp. NBRC 103695]|uniref:hypothetical protein n=1 Tax=Actinoplanes sp. NBRC 103695 TaxID=3032202 RepID=UPI0024A334CE|nr:hypothetical protein [Actinoplanes sp. NBRC 103695]GLZ00035.1 hypothetical protein Acsp02_72870 [Actinoplanes sp. NBRC 103695]